MAMTCLLLLSCRGDEILEEELQMPPIDTFQTFFETDLDGRVIAEDGTPIPQARISANGLQTETDDFGFYSIENVDASSSGLYIDVTAQNFHQGGTHYFAQQIGEVYNEIVLSSRLSQSFMAGEDIIFQGQQGLEVMIPSNSFSLNGNVYDGIVEFSAKVFDLQNQDNLIVLPGQLKGQGEDECGFINASIGLVVEVFTSSGFPLDLLDGQEASVTLSSSFTPPSNSSIWTLQRTTGTWTRSDNTTTTSGSNTFTVNQLGWHALGDLSESSVVCLDITTEDGSSIQGRYSLIGPERTFGTQRLPNNNDNCHIVPRNTPIVISFQNPCGEEFYSADIGSFTNSVFEASTVDLVVPLSTLDPTVTLTGSLLDCDNNSVTTGGIVGVAYRDQEYYDFEIDQNGYAIDLRICDAIAEVEITGYDLENAQSTSVMAEVSNSTGQENNLALCDNPIETIFTLNDGVNQVVLENVTAIVSRAETLIIANDGIDNASSILLGFREKTIGTHMGNILGIREEIETGAFLGIADQATFEIDAYGGYWFIRKRIVLRRGHYWKFHSATNQVIHL